MSVTVIEGPDGGGKTTLASNIGGTAWYRHQGPYGEDPLCESLEDISPAFMDTSVFDRLHLGEQVYGPLLRGKDKIGPIYRRMIERVLLAHQAVLVLAIPAYERALANWREGQKAKGELFSDEEVFDRSYQAFEGIETDLPTVVYNYEVETVASVQERIDDKRLPWWLDLFIPGGAGSFQQGNILLVGEKVSATNIETPWPFVGKNGSAAFITSYLDEWDVPESRLFWVNARYPDGQWTDDVFVRHLQPRITIALGRTAQGWCERAGIHHVAVPHPSYWMRFRYHEEYTPLKEALLWS